MLPSLTTKKWYGPEVSLPLLVQVKVSTFTFDGAQAGLSLANIAYSLCGGVGGLNNNQPSQLAVRDMDTTRIRVTGGKGSNAPVDEPEFCLIVWRLV